MLLYMLSVVYAECHYVCMLSVIMQVYICRVLYILGAAYAESCKCWVLYILSVFYIVTMKPIILSIVILDVTMLRVVTLNVITRSIIIAECQN
jgi:hypothetical protein